MSVGYSDYARLSQQGGQLLFNTSGNVTPLVPVFQGFVGSWPYFNLVTNCNSSTDFVRVVMTYADGPSFANIVGFRYAIRSGSAFAITQYENLSPWLTVYVTTISNNAFPFIELSGYATIGPASVLINQSNDVPINWINPTVGASSTADFLTPRVTPGPGHLYFTAAANTYTYRHRYYDYGSASFKNLFVIQGAISGNQWDLDVPMIDAPYQMEITNTAAAAASYTVSWLTKAQLWKETCQFSLR